MKPCSFRLLLLCAMACLSFTAARSSKDMYTKERKQTFGYINIKTNEILKLKNDFGPIIIIPWDRDEIVLQRNLSVSARNANDAEEKLNSRKMNVGHRGNTYSFILDTSPTKTNCTDLRDEWKVYIPKDKLSFDIKNSFGDVNFMNSIKCEQLNIHVGFGKISMDGEMQVNDKCSITVEHGGLNIGKINKATLKTAFTEIDIKEVGTLDFAVEYGKMNIRQMGIGKGKTSFTNSVVYSLKKNLDVSSCEHGKFEVTLTDKKSFGGLSIISSFSNVSLNLAKKISAHYELKSHQGNIKINTEVHSTHQQERDVNNDFVSKNIGYIGNNSAPKAEIKVSAEFADIKLN